MILVVELGAVLALPQEYLPAARVQLRILRYVVHSALEYCPAVVLLSVLGHLLCSVEDAVRVLDECLHVPLVELNLHAVFHGHLDSRHALQEPSQLLLLILMTIVFVELGLGQFGDVEGEDVVHFHLLPRLPRYLHDLYQLFLVVEVESISLVELGQMVKERVLGSMSFEQHFFYAGLEDLLKSGDAFLVKVQLNLLVLHFTDAHPLLYEVHDEEE
mmetsp:Transcript_17458/g.29380  ORF Transcript_17458/g.29380 Transcript_17458/m.29380 type:complete len:216 (-) Transcript_17458:119-766(-)